MEHFYNISERKVLEDFKEKIESENKSIFKTEYRYPYKGEIYVFDLVELTDNGKILKVYELKPQSSVYNNPRSLNSIIELYKKITKAEVCLVAYYGDITNLQYHYYNDLLPVTPPEVMEASSFSGFYGCLNKKCYDAGNYFFRGHSDYRHKTIPSIYRDNNIQNETVFYHEAIRKCPTEFTEDMSTFDKLVKMQHYELPTRLLDITTNPLIALFFACKGKNDVDGEVLIYSMLPKQIEYFDEDHISILSNLAKCSHDFTFTKGKKVLVSYIKQDKPSFNGRNLKADSVKKVLCVKPKLNNERIIRQHGAFFIFGMGTSKETPAELLDLPHRIRIKAAAKKEILKELDMLGINEAELFPETDKIMKHIKKQYT